MTEDYWANSQFSIVRYTGSMKWNGVAYIICNKEGKDIIAKAVENVPQAAEASEMIRHYISVGVRLMKAQVYAQEMVED